MRIPKQATVQPKRVLCLLFAIIFGATGIWLEVVAYAATHTHQQSAVATDSAPASQAAVAAMLIGVVLLAIAATFAVAAIRLNRPRKP